MISSHDPAAQTPGGSVQGSPRRTLGVEEEFHIVDRTTRRLAPRAPELLALLEGHRSYVAEMQRCVIEVNSDVVDDLEALHEELTRRRFLAEKVAELDLMVVASGTVPLAVPSELPLTSTSRFRRMLADYQLLAREQLICGTQVHVGVDDRGDAVAISERVATDLPTLLALSASSPFSADGHDNGYASVRSLIWSRWPTAGLSSGTRKAAELDALVEKLVDSGVITDPGMMYFDTRPSSRIPTLELRICDSCPSSDTILLIAGLFRAMVDRECEAHKADEPVFEMPGALGRAATWRAARSGLEGDLVDLRAGRSAPAGDVVHTLVDSLEPWLRRNGDWEIITSLADGAPPSARSRPGSVASCATAAGSRTSSIILAAGTAHATFEGPRVRAVARVQNVTPLVPSYDEAVDEHGMPREIYRPMLERIRDLGLPWLRRREEALVHLARAQGVTFRVNGETEPRVFPTDPVPRLITAEDWTHLDAGGRQRARALNAFLRDIYDRREIVRDGVLPKDVLDRAPGYRSIGRQHEGGVRAHISGLDIVSDGAGSWRVLEDNLRVPSGVGYAMSNRYLAHKLLGDLPHEDLLDTRAVPGLLTETLTSAAPGGGCEHEEIVILSSGRTDSAWPEHEGLARGMGIDVVTPADLRFRSGSMTRRLAGRDAPVRVAYLRIDEDMLLTSHDADGLPMRFGVVEAMHRDTLSLANTLGNGVGDDKAVYAYVPTMIDYYLGEKPILDQVPTLLCADREACESVLDRLDELVTKPIDGYGGIGVVIGPDASEQQLAERRREIMSNPERYIAQEVIDLSTCPTFDDDGLRPHHVDLRVFVHLRERAGQVEAVTMPAPLTRVGSAGNKIVNSSSGGGSKDTWILAPASGNQVEYEQRQDEHEGVR